MNLRKSRHMQLIKGFGAKRLASIGMYRVLFREKRSSVLAHMQ